MSEITRALSKLNRAVHMLEGTADHVESALSGQQRDMFSAPPANSNASKIDKELVAGKLDLAITKIEEILGEGEKAHG